MMHRMTTLVLMALAVCSLSATAAPPASQIGAGQHSQPTPSADQRARAYFTDVPLLTQDGETVRFYSDVLKDRVVLINFIYTHCGDACPLMTRQLTLVRDMLGERIGDPIYFVSISIDPRRDTHEALKKFAQENEADHAGWIFLTGKPENVNFIVKRLGQYTENVEAHSTLLLAGNVKAQHWMKIPPTVPPMGIAEKLRRLAGEGIAVGAAGS